MADSPRQQELYLMVARNEENAGKKDKIKTKPNNSGQTLDVDVKEARV